MEDIYDKVLQIFYKLAYRTLLCLWFFTRPTVYGVYIVVWYGKQLLIIENSYKKLFTIPCGRIKRSEESADAAVRELYEEVGIAVEKDRLTYLGEYSAKQNYALDVGKFFEIRLAELPEVRVDNREVVLAHFIPFERVSKLNLNPTVKVWLDSLK